MSYNENNLNIKKKDCQEGATIHNNEYLDFLFRNTTVQKLKREDGLEVLSFRLFGDAVFDIQLDALKDKEIIIQHMIQIYYLGHIGNIGTKIARELVREQGVYSKKESEPLGEENHE